jgi:hypothetical protein
MRRGDFAEQPILLFRLAPRALEIYDPAISAKAEIQGEMRWRQEEGVTDTP